VRTLPKATTLAALLALIGSGAVADEGARCDPAKPDTCVLCTVEGKPAVCEERGKMIDRSASFAHAPPHSAEFELSGISGLSPSDIRVMRETVVTLPAQPPRESTVLRDSLAGANFDSGRADLLPAAIQRLEALAAQLAGKRSVRLKIVGHTDDQRLAPATAARFRDNDGLSAARAAAVAAWLKDRLDLAVDAIGIEGKGAREPVASNATPDGMAQNRRVEISAWFEEVTVTPAPAAQTETRRSEQSGCGPEGAAAASQLPFRISIDGVPMEEDGARPEADRERCVDVGLERADIQIKYDPLNVSPALNVWVAKNGILRGKPAEFGSYSNYVRWVKRAEVRIFAPDQRLQEKPLAILPIPLGGFVEWVPPPEMPAELKFLLRVVDERERFDETAAKPLTLLARETGFDDADEPGRERLTGWGESSRQLGNIPVAGGTVSVSGEKIRPGERVTVFGAPVPVDPQGRFAVRQIVPTGPHTVEVAVSEAGGANPRVFRRNLSVADESWFYVAIADLTIGRGHTSGAPKEAIEALTGDDTHYRNETYVDGRGAFYLRGKIKGEYLLKIAADTREQPLKDLFSNFWSKDPRYLLRRIDPDKFYPVYGDDSTIVDDAPTQGKFFVRIERGDSHVMWGNFQTAWSGTELTQYSRGLYGGNLEWKSTAATAFGEKRTVISAFAAEPGTIAAREEFRATGGSLYYLRRQDVTQGSERVWVEVRDKNSDIALERKPLSPAQDYDINYLQGRILLRGPLSSTAEAAGLVQTATLNGNPVYLVVTYEFAPGLAALDALSVGMRGSHWLNDKLRLGFTSYRQGDDGADQKLRGLDATLRYAPGTWLRGEVARSSGAGTALLSSIDGGFDFDTRRGRSGRAEGRRLEGAADLAEVWSGGAGKLSAYWQDREAGFSAPGQITAGNEAIEQRGVAARLPIGPATSIELKADERLADTQDYQALEGGLRHQFTPSWGAAIGVRRDERDTRVANASSLLSENGGRTDVVLRADYRHLDASEAFGAAAPWELYGFLQGTAAKSGDRRDNDRYGLGGAWQATDRLKLGAEASGGDGGIGGRLFGDWRVDDRSNYYLNYAMETERPESSFRGRQGNLTTGSRYRLTEEVAFFGETRWQNGAGPQSLTQAFGVDLAPNDRWALGAKFETGKLSDPLAGDLKRYALGLSAGYKTQETKFSSALEYRDENGNDGQRTTWLMRNTLGHQATPAWRLLGKLNFSFSQASRGNFFDGDFIEFVSGAAYRPIDNDRWNTLIKYTYFYDLPSPGQVDRESVRLDFAQKSHVFSLDTIVDLRPWVSVGFKYGLRVGELRASRTEGEWFDSRADLIVGRLDFHWVKEWDAVVEARRLHAYEANDTRGGFLVAVYRHFGEHFKAGIGYNFTDFSDDLTDLSFRSRGVFVNLISTF
jgi:outer membrane protein OmpA-like peptidoglycan-associated protein